MVKRDMLRSSWTRVLSKKQIIRDFSFGELNGKVSLLKILELTAPMRRVMDGDDVVLADTGYCWLQLALDGSHYWFTAMFDEQDRFIQLYVDVTGGNEALAEDPVFEDMYLDYVVYGSRVFELDRDELDEAYSLGEITKEQYERALADGEKMFRDLTQNTERIKAFFGERFEELKRDLEASDGAGSAGAGKSGIKSAEEKRT
jgi:predicted RNA-binding protein associated with RNAse of E/G family